MRGPTNAGVRYCFSTTIGIGSVAVPTVTSTSPTMPEPPIPSTTMLSKSEASGSSDSVDARGGLVRGGQLLGPAAHRLEHAQGVDAHGG